MAFFNYDLKTKEFVIGDCPHNGNPNWISKELTYDEDRHHHCLIAIADNEIFEFDIADMDPWVFASVYRMGLNKYLSLHGGKACTLKENINNIIDFLTYYNGKVDYVCVYQIRNQGVFFPNGQDDYTVYKHVIFDKGWEKRHISLYGSVSTGFFDLEVVEGDEKPVGYELLDDFCVCRDRFNVTSLVSENNAILSTAIIEPDILSGFGATPINENDRIGRPYYWRCLYIDGKWDVTDLNEQLY